MCPATFISCAPNLTEDVRRSMSLQKSAVKRRNTEWIFLGPKCKMIGLMYFHCHCKYFVTLSVYVYVNRRIQGLAMQVLQMLFYIFLVTCRCAVQYASCKYLMHICMYSCAVIKIYLCICDHMCVYTHVHAKMRYDPRLNLYSSIHVCDRKWNWLTTWHWLVPHMFGHFSPFLLGRQRMDSMKRT